MDWRQEGTFTKRKIFNNNWCIDEIFSRRFSDPCLANNSDEESAQQSTADKLNLKNQSDNNKLLATLIQQINYLHETNSKICRNLNDTKGEPPTASLYSARVGFFLSSFYIFRLIKFTRDRHFLLIAADICRLQAPLEWPSFFFVRNRFRAVLKKKKYEFGTEFGDFSFSRDVMIPTSFNIYIESIIGVRIKLFHFMNSLSSILLNKPRNAHIVHKIYSTYNYSYYSYICTIWTELNSFIAPQWREREREKKYVDEPIVCSNDVYFVWLTLQQFLPFSHYVLNCAFSFS